MNIAFKLYRLQQIDSMLDQAKNRHKDIEFALQNDDALIQSKKNLEIASSNLVNSQKSLKEAEDKVREHRLKIEQNESTLYSGKITNPKELQDIQKEVASLKKFLITLEDRQLEMMINYDEAHLEYIRVQDLHHDEEKNSEVKKQQLMDELIIIDGDIDRIEIERHATLTSITDTEITVYEKLREQRRGVAVAIIAEKCCSACGSTLNAALLQTAKSPTQLIRCPSCGRILYSGN